MKVKVVKSPKKNTWISAFEGKLVGWVTANGVHGLVVHPTGDIHAVHISLLQYADEPLKGYKVFEDPKPKVEKKKVASKPKPKPKKEPIPLDYPEEKPLPAAARKVGSISQDSIGSDIVVGSLPTKR